MTTNKIYVFALFVLVCSIQLNQAQNTYATLEAGKQYQQEAYIEEQRPEPSSGGAGGAGGSDDDLFEGFEELDDFDDVEEYRVDGQAGKNPIRHGEPPRIDGCGEQNEGNTDVTLSVHPFAIDLSLAAQNKVPNFMILGVLIGAYNPWEEAEHEGHGGHGGDRDDGSSLRAVYINKSTQLIQVAFDDTTDYSQLEIVPLIPQWFVPLDSSSSPFWNRHNAPREPWAFDKPPLKEDGTPYWDPSAALPSFKFVGRVEYEQLLGYADGENFKRVQLVAVNELSMLVDPKANLKSEDIMIIPFSSKFFTPVNKETLKPLWAEGQEPSEDWNIQNPPNNPNNGNAPYWTEATKPLLRFDQERLEDELEKLHDFDFGQGAIGPIQAYGLLELYYHINLHGNRGFDDKEDDHGDDGMGGHDGGEHDGGEHDGGEHEQGPRYEDLVYMKTYAEVNGITLSVAQQTLLDGSIASFESQTPLTDLQLAGLGQLYQEVFEPLFAQHNSENDEIELHELRHIKTEISLRQIQTTSEEQTLLDGAITKLAASTALTQEEKEGLAAIHFKYFGADEEQEEFREQEDDGYLSIDEAPFFVYVQADNTVFLGTPSQPSNLSIRPFHPRFYTYVDANGNNAWDPQTAPQQRWDFWNPPRKSDGTLHWDAANLASITFKFIGQDFFEQFPIARDNYRPWVLVAVNQNDLRVNWQADLSSPDIVVVRFHPKWFRLLQADGTTEQAIAANPGYYTPANPPLNGAGSADAWTGNDVSTYPIFELQPNKLLAELMKIHSQHQEEDQFAKREVYYYVQFEAVDTQNNYVVKPTLENPVTTASTNIKVVKFNHEDFLPINPTEDPKVPYFEDDQRPSNTNGLIPWDPKNPPNSLWNPTQVEIDLVLVPRARQNYELIHNFGNEFWGPVPIDVYRSELAIGRPLNDINIRIVDWDPHYFIPQTANGPAWREDDQPQDYWNWLQPPQKDGNNLFTVGANNKFKYVGPLPEEPKVLYVYVKRADNLVVFDLKALAADEIIDIIPFNPRQFTPLDGSDQPIFTDLPDWDFKRPPIYVDNNQNKQPYFDPATQRKFRFEAQARTDFEARLNRGGNQLRLVAVDVKTRLVVQRANLFSKDIEVLVWDDKLFELVKRNAETGQLEALLTTRPTAFWSFESPPTGAPASWVGNQPSTYPLAQYRGRFPRAQRDEFRNPRPRVNENGLIINAQTDFVMWEKKDGVAVYRVPFNPEWFVAVGDDGANLFDPETVEFWHFFMPPTNESGEPLWDPNDQASWPKFKFIGKAEYQQQSFDIRRLFLELDPSGYTYEWSLHSAYDISEVQNQFPCDIDSRIYLQVRDALLASASGFPFANGWECENVKRFGRDLKSQGKDVVIDAQFQKDLQQFNREAGVKLEGIIRDAIINGDIDLEAAGIEVDEDGNFVISEDDEGQEEGAPEVRRALQETQPPPEGDGQQGDGQIQISAEQKAKVEALLQLDYADPKQQKQVRETVKMIFKLSQRARSMFREAYQWMFEQDLDDTDNQFTLEMLTRELVSELLRSNNIEYNADYYRRQLVRPSVPDRVARAVPSEWLLSDSELATLQTAFFSGVTRTDQEITIPAANFQAGKLYVVQCVVKKGTEVISTTHTVLEGQPENKEFVDLDVTGIITVVVVNADGTETVVEKFEPFKAYKVKYDLTDVWAELNANNNVQLFYGKYTDDYPTVEKLSSATGSFDVSFQFDGLNVGLVALRAELATEIHFGLAGMTMEGDSCDDVFKPKDISNLIPEEGSLSDAQFDALFKLKREQKELIKEKETKPANLARKATSFCLNDCGGATNGQCTVQATGNSVCVCLQGFAGKDCSKSTAEVNRIAKAIKDNIAARTISTPEDRRKLFSDTASALGGNEITPDLVNTVKDKVKQQLANIQSADEAFEALKSVVALSRAEQSVSAPTNKQELRAQQVEVRQQLKTIIKAAIKSQFAAGKPVQLNEEGVSGKASPKESVPQKPYSEVSAGASAGAGAGAGSSRRFLETVKTISGNVYVFTGSSFNDLPAPQVIVPQNHPMFSTGGAAGVQVTTYGSQFTNGIEGVENTYSPFTDVSFIDSNGAVVEFNDAENPIEITLPIETQPPADITLSAAYIKGQGTATESLADDGIVFKSKTSTLATFQSSHNGYFALSKKIVVSTTPGDNNNDNSNEDNNNGITLSIMFAMLVLSLLF